MTSRASPSRLAMELDPSLITCLVTETHHDTRSRHPSLRRVLRCRTQKRQSAHSSWAVPASGLPEGASMTTPGPADVAAAHRRLRAQQGRFVPKPVLPALDE